jgi:transcriptional regulator with XRE-family HTH domain
LVWSLNPELYSHIYSIAMISSEVRQPQTIGEVLYQLREQHGLGSVAVATGLCTTSSTYLKVERGQRELSFLMALRVCQFYQLDLHEFISLLSDEELNRQDWSVIRVQQQRERKKAEASQARVVSMNKASGR